MKGVDEMKNARSEAFNQYIHPNTKKQDFHTPQFIIKWLKDLIGERFVDAAWSNELKNNVSETFDLWGEKKPEGWIFINPPWDTETTLRFMERALYFAEEGSTVVWLLPNKLTQTHWVKSMNPYFDSIIFLGGRLNFSGPWSVDGGSSRYGTFIGIQNPPMKIKKGFDSVLIREIKARYPIDQC